MMQIVMGFLANKKHYFLQWVITFETLVARLDYNYYKEKLRPESIPLELNILLQVT